MKKVIYTQLDMISNSVLTKGIHPNDFYRAMSHLPENLLLLNPNCNDGEFENHTGFKIIRHNKVEEYFNGSLSRNEKREWIDFNDIHLLKQLTPIEISELLYFGHMKKHLHSPFFYKLQNNYVFLQLTDEINKVYYRHINEFYCVLAQKIHQEITERVNHRRGLFKKVIDVPKIEEEVISQLKTILQEGVIFHFEHLTWDDTHYRLPIYLVEDRVRNVEDVTYSDDLLLAELCYDQQWTIQMNKDIV